nr:uncharacterized protein LOC109766255 [Aegilops tauschii subsp. strangulata]
MRGEPATGQRGPHARNRAKPAAGAGDPKLTRAGRVEAQSATEPTGRRGRRAGGGRGRLTGASSRAGVRACGLEADADGAGGRVAGENIASRTRLQEQQTGPALPDAAAATRANQQRAKPSGAGGRQRTQRACGRGGEAAGARMRPEARGSRPLPGARGGGRV